MTDRSVLHVAFKEAYERWRDNLIEQDWNGRPLAEPCGGDLFREISLALDAHGLEVCRVEQNLATTSQVR